MATIPTDPHCRSCRYYVSAPETFGIGVCSNGNSRWLHEWVPIGFSCCEHDNLQGPDGPLDGHLLIERECLACEHVNLYSFGFEGVAWCASPDCPTNQGGNT